MKQAIFAKNAARPFHLDVEAKRLRLPDDYLGRMRMAYREAGPRPSHRFYGWIRV